MAVSQLLLLIRPSWASFGLTILVGAVLLYAANWAYVAASPWLYDAFYGEHGIVTTLERSPNAVAAVQEGITTNTAVYVTALCLIAVLTGGAVFIIFHSVLHGIRVIRALRTSTPLDQHEQLQRALIRMAVLALWEEVFHM